MAERKTTTNKKSPQTTKKSSSTSVERSKNTRANDKNSSKAPKVRFDNPSDRFIHQVIPFVLIALALLLEVCFVLALINGEKLVGIAGVFLKDVFFGLFGFCAFVLPLMLLNLAINWRKFVDSHMVRAKIVFTVLFLVSFAGLIHIFVKGAINSDVTVFLLPDKIFAFSSEKIFSSGAIGGFFCECIYFLFKSVGSTIILITLSILFLIFSLGISLRSIGNKIRDKWDIFAYEQKKKSEARREEKAEERRIAKEEKQEQKRLEKEAREEERARLEAEEEMMRQAEKQIEEERIAEAERRAIEREEREKKDKEKYGEMRFVEPEKVTYEEPELKKAELDDAPEEDDDGRIDVAAIFRNPPKQFDPVQLLQDDEDIFEEEPEESPAEVITPEKPKKAKKEERLEVEIKENTEIDTVPDDGEDSTVPENIVREYVRPNVELLKNYKNEENEKVAHEEIRANASALMETLKSFGVRIQEITYSRGPTITRYELKPDVGVRIRAIANLVDDIALSLATTGVRIEAPIPNKAAVGIEVPNKTAATVGLRSLIDSPEFEEKKSVLTAALGKDVGGNSVYFDIGKMPHMLIAGTTGSGKSVCINCIIMSILYKASPRDVKLILIDPKKVEFQPFRSIPHLYAPIVTDPKKAAGALASAVAEMERRFELIENVGAKNISGYNELTANDPSKEYLPYIVIIIDELADLMMTAADDVETAICRIAQKARAAGIHLIVGTQRPSVDVVTGLIKANIPSRIAFTVASQVDSKTILDSAGADKLIGRGDMLFAPIGSTKPMRVQGAFVDDREVERIVDFINEHNDGVSFNDAFIQRLEEEAAKCGNPKGKGGGGSFAGMDDGEPGEEGVDPKFKQALDVAIEMGKISTSLLQRRLEIGYGRAAKIIDRMEALGYVSAPDGNKPRVILVTKADIMEKRVNDEE
ncbi:MAG: DNA translocase FtsK [Clostridia bacterium]|nr:DNA translocase FtsK [Clostridia bacterium]